MPQNALALDLLKHDVPLALLFDLAGLGPSSEELYRAEGSRVPQSRAALSVVAVAS